MASVVVMRLPSGDQCGHWCVSGRSRSRCDPSGFTVYRTVSSCAERTGQRRSDHSLGGRRPATDRKQRREDQARITPATASIFHAGLTATRGKPIVLAVIE